MSLARFQSRSKARPAARSNERAISLWEPVAHMALSVTLKGSFSGSGSARRITCSLKGRFWDARGWSFGSNALWFFLCFFSVMFLDSIWMKPGYTRRQRGRNLEIGEVGCVGWAFYCFACMHACMHENRISLSNQTILPDNFPVVFQLCFFSPPKVKCQLENERILAWLIW